MKSFRIELVTVGQEATVYSIRFKGEKYTETQKFFLKHREQYLRELQEIQTVIENIANRRGAHEHYTVKIKEGRRTDAVVALPNFKSRLRLYCLRMSQQTIILFNGGFKSDNTRAYQDDPELDRIVEELQEVNKLIDERLRPPFWEIYYQGNNLAGELEFNFDEDEE